MSGPPERTQGADGRSRSLLADQVAQAERARAIRQAARPLDVHGHRQRARWPRAAPGHRVPQRGRRQGPLGTLLAPHRTGKLGPRPAASLNWSCPPVWNTAHLSQLSRYVNIALPARAQEWYLRRRQLSIEAKAEPPPPSWLSSQPSHSQLASTGRRRRAARRAARACGAAGQRNGHESARTHRVFRVRTALSPGCPPPRPLRPSAAQRRSRSPRSPPPRPRSW